ncbi:variable large family protein (plasmid) [Borrelia puertoricensis]|uniref:variable large family protein n=1 Tax=Borrelia puertoricensis TaxID=2756107 RepID=UPI003EB814EE
MCVILTLFLLLSCGSGTTSAGDPKTTFLTSIANLSNDFLNVFTSLSDMVGGVLGFNTNTKKSDVAVYFKTVQETLSSTKRSLEKIVEDMKSENNPNASKTETTVRTLVDDTLSKIIDGAKTASEAIGSDASDLLGNVAAGGAGAAAGAKGENVENLIKGIKHIVDIVLKGKGSADAGTDKKADDLAARTANDGVAKLFASDNAGDEANLKKVAADAAKAVGAVTGADILQAIVKDGGAAAKLAINNTASAGGVATADNAKDATVAGGIALRAMAKNGKFAGSSDNANDDAKKAVEGAALSAVTKALDTLTIAIRNTIDEGLKTVKDAIKFNSTDTSVTTDKQVPETKS